MHGCYSLPLLNRDEKKDAKIDNNKITKQQRRRTKHTQNNERIGIKNRKASDRTQMDKTVASQETLIQFVKNFVWTVCSSLQSVHCFSFLGLYRYHI